MAIKYFCDCCGAEIKPGENCALRQSVPYRHGNKHLSLEFTIEGDGAEVDHICLNCALAGFDSIDRRPKAI